MDKKTALLFTFLLVGLCSIRAYASSATATPSFNTGTGTYYAPLPVIISDGTAGATIYYTTNGTAPSTSSTVYSGQIMISSTTTVEAIAVYSGSSSAIASKHSPSPPRTHRRSTQVAPALFMLRFL